jgi:hypothetical protein
MQRTVFESDLTKINRDVNNYVPQSLNAPLERAFNELTPVQISGSIKR